MCVFLCVLIHPPCGRLGPSHCTPERMHLLDKQSILGALHVTVETHLYAWRPERRCGASLLCYCVTAAVSAVHATQHSWGMRTRAASPS